MYRHDGRRGPVWRARYRCLTAGQVHRTIGPAWLERGRPADGYVTKRTAEAWLRDVMEQARKGTLPGVVRTDATVADAAAEYLRYVEHDRGRKPSTVEGYRSVIEAHILPAFGETRVEDLTTRMVERWIRDVDRSARTKNKLVQMLHSIMERARKVHGMPVNPVADVEKTPLRQSGDIAVHSPEEVMALVRAADSEQDAAI